MSGYERWMRREAERLLPCLNEKTRGKGDKTTNNEETLGKAARGKQTRKSYNTYSAGKAPRRPAGGGKDRKRGKVKRSRTGPVGRGSEGERDESTY